MVDIGATYTRIGIGSRTGIIVKKKFNTPREGDEYTIAKTIYEEVLRNYSEYLEKIVAIGVATIGPLDIYRGRVVNTPNIPIHSFELRRPLVELLGKPVYVLNDAVAGVLGEKVFGDGRGYRNIVYITMSSGVGGGVIVDDHLLIGKKGNAHEIGHIVVKYDSDIRCGCGGTGHWEAYAGGVNIPRLTYMLAKKYSGLNTEAWRKAINREIDPPGVFKYYRMGDLFAVKVVEEIIEASAAGLASVINLYDPELVTIGGSVFLNNIDIFLEPLVERVEKHLVTDKPIIKPTRLGEDIVLYGALALAINPPEIIRQLSSIDLSPDKV